MGQNQKAKHNATASCRPPRQLCVETPSRGRGWGRRREFFYVKSSNMLPNRLLIASALLMGLCGASHIDSGHRHGYLEESVEREGAVEDSIDTLTVPQAHGNDQLSLETSFDDLFQGTIPQLECNATAECTYEGNKGATKKARQKRRDRKGATKRQE
ncbi:unnamed protein product [Vitrella brassicaformis CCMP3155]|uniref:Uncharacterized protein n=1 Tax=Vitrella brassicaformis (strain CCMP3155) TaxID=1169540 RepID=A0A0G4GAY6_VITBC|nr:unnamed protein product [Vitrella brassicaformis CCMP3155]|eukprot:CEM25976.1 unnamed protein product [Vitrella brassicaformis CCMP3155]